MNEREQEAEDRAVLKEAKKSDAMIYLLAISATVAIVIALLAWIHVLPVSEMPAQRVPGGGSPSEAQ